MRKGSLIIWLVILLAGIVTMFWRTEVVYSLPTPVPANYNAVNMGDKIDLHNKLSVGQKPLFLHFFNPDCPCSRFNIEHFKSLVKAHANDADFKIVAMTSPKNYTAQEIQAKFHLDVPVLFDSSIAAACGVYSTPQAVIIGSDKKLFYRGNYNKSRYCTDKKSNYAQMALDSLLQHHETLNFNQYAFKAYGCQLPKCSK